MTVTILTLDSTELRLDQSSGTQFDNGKDDFTIDATFSALPGDFADWTCHGFVPAT